MLRLVGLVGILAIALIVCEVVKGDDQFRTWEPNPNLSGAAR